MDPIVKTVDRLFLRCDAFLLFSPPQGRVEMHFGRCLVVQRLMEPLLVVKLEVGRKPPAGGSSYSCR